MATQPQPEQPATATAPAPQGSPTKTARWTCRVLGLALVLLAAIGFATGEQTLAGLTVNAMHSMLHLLVGLVVLGLGFASEPAARATCWSVAGLFALLALLRFAGVMTAIEALNLNAVGNWLYLVLAIVLVACAGLSHAQERARLATHEPTPGIRHLHRGGGHQAG